jgi:serine/threonine protein kinase
VALSSGTRLGPYEVLSHLGAGGMGEVYRARDTKLDRDVAVKVLPADLANDPEALSRFEREARAISSLSHPHICALYDVGSEDGLEYLVMELLEGETLAERLTKGTLPFAGTSNASLIGAILRFSPDSRWIAYESEESGRGEIHVAAFPGPGGKC